jgi:hypothetical protein
MVEHILAGSFSLCSQYEDVIFLRIRMSISVSDLSAKYLSLVAKDRVEFERRLNEAHARLLETAKWDWCKVEADLDVVDGCVYLDPAVYSSLLGVRVDKSGRTIYPREAEYNPTTGYKAEVGEPGLGHLVSCGMVTIVVDDEEVRRKKYRIADIVTGTTVEALLHLSHVHLCHPDDYLICPSSRAMKMAMMALHYEEVDDFDRAKACWAEAYQALNEHESTTRGGVRGNVQIQPFGDGVEPVGAIM